MFAVLAGILMRRWWAAPAVAALWVAIEVTHGSLGFAWLALGNAGIDMSVPLRLAPYTGVYGLSFLFALMAAVLALAILRRPRIELLWLLLVPPAGAAAAHARSAQRLRDGAPRPAEYLGDRGMDAGNGGPHDAAAGRALAAGALAQTGQPPPELVVWPEVPAPLYYYEDERFRDVRQRPGAHDPAPTC